MGRILYHGGVPGLKPGDVIEPGHSRDHTDDRPICRMRREHGADAPTPEATLHPESVYCTTSRLYAREYASLYGHGDVYQVEPLGELTPSDEGDIDSYRCAKLKVKRVVDVHVELTWRERRRLHRPSTGGGFDPDPSPRNATPRMINDWQRRQLLLAERLTRQ